NKESRSVYPDVVLSHELFGPKHTVTFRYNIIIIHCQRVRNFHLLSKFFVRVLVIWAYANYFNSLAFKFMVIFCEIKGLGCTAWSKIAGIEINHNLFSLD